MPKKKIDIAESKSQPIITDEKIVEQLPEVAVPIEVTPEVIIEPKPATPEQVEKFKSIQPHFTPIVKEKAEEMKIQMWRRGRETINKDDVNLGRAQ